MGDATEVNRTANTSKDSEECSHHSQYEWLPKFNKCYSKCVSPAQAEISPSSGLPICVTPQGVTFDERGGRSDVNAHTGTKNVIPPDSTSHETVQSKATKAARQTDVFYRDDNTGLVIPENIPMEYVLTLASGLSIAFFILRR